MGKFKYSYIYDVVEFYVLNKDKINIKEKEEMHKSKHSLLDNAAIFLRILDKNMSNISREYMSNHEKIKEILAKIDKNWQTVYEDQKSIDSLMEIDVVKLKDDDMPVFGLHDCGLLGNKIQTIFIDSEQSLDSKEKLEKLKEFYTNLLLNHGRCIGNAQQFNLKIKSGCMFQYFKLSDKLIDTTTKLINYLNEYKEYREIQNNYNQELSNITKNIEQEITELYSLDENSFKKIINDVNEFIGNKKVN